MLVLTRKKGESIIIDAGGGIEVTVIETGTGSVRIGVKAPRTVDVWRKEIIEEVATANRDATATNETKEALKELENLFARPGTKKTEQPQF